VTAGKLLIVNADDLGLSSGVNEGIAQAHTGGIVTSASLMVRGPAAAEAAAVARDHPGLSVGLHWVGDDVDAVSDEVAAQLDAFVSLVGRKPAHVDSHHHLHREEHLVGLFEELVAPLGVPLRGDGRIAHVGGFYAQWEWKVTNLEYVSVGFLQRLLREEVHEGWTEISCHPAVLRGDLESAYLEEREAELRTLTDPRVTDTIRQLGIELVNYDDWALRNPGGG
jgi:predicted glycoside hydrolase/deacetylase ChbG (UPF0249 family)